MADIVYKDFMKIYRECTNEPFSFLTVDTTLLANNPVRLKKICYNLIKITVTDQIKILDSKIKANQTQWDLGRKTAEISALSSKNVLDKYESLTGEDLGHELNASEKAKYEYSQWVMSLSKAFKED